MVLALMRLRKLREEEREKQKQWREEGREQGLREERQRWQEWWARQADEIRAAGLSVDDPPVEENGASPETER